MIELRAVTKMYPGGVTALNALSLDIARHEFVSITGPSGCGKSTLLHLLGGMDRPDSGSIVVDGLPLHTADETMLTAFRRKTLGTVFQFFHLMPTFSVAENVALPLLLAGSALAPARARAAELLELVGLQDRAAHFPNQLSGGQMQRAALARALVHEPALLLADEPTGNLDTQNASQVLELLAKIASLRRTTLVVVTHSEEVANRADRRIRLRDGTLQQS
jgi:ABC-type lipoprotein export system ATPase subunit